MTLRLKWMKTWPDVPADFIAKIDDGQSVCRVYFSPGSPSRPEEWYWTCNGRYRGRSGSMSGFAETKNEAARLAEAAWFDMVERIDRDLGPVFG